MKNKLKLIGNILIWVYIAFALVITPLFLSTCSSAKSYPELFGKMFITASSSNLSPEINKDDLLIVSQASEDEIFSLSENGIIIYDTKDEITGKDVVIIDRVEKTFSEKETKTFDLENNESIIIEKTENGIKGAEILATEKGIQISNIGEVIAFLTTPTGYILAVVIPIVFLFAFELFNYMIVAMGVKKISVESEEEIKKKAIEDYINKKEE